MEDSLATAKTIVADVLHLRGRFIRTALPLSPERIARARRWEHLVPENATLVDPLFVTRLAAALRTESDPPPGAAPVLRT